MKLKLWLTLLVLLISCASAFCQITVQGQIQINGTSSGGMLWPSTPGITNCTGTPCTAWGSSYVVGNSGSDIPQLSGGFLNTSIIPTATIWPCTSADPFMTNPSGVPGCSASSAATQRGIDATVVGGLNASATDNTSTWLSMLATYCASSACSIYIPCFHGASNNYNFTSNPVVPVTSSTYTGVKIYAEGRASYTGNNCVTFTQNTPGDWGMWWDNTSVGAGNNGGPDIENIKFVDGTTTTACNSAYGANAVANHPSVVTGGCAAGGLRVTQTNYGILRNVSTQGFAGILNWNGANNGAGTATLTVTNGNNAFSCSGCTFTSAMIFGHLWVNGDMQEIQTVSGSSGTFTSNWEYPSATNTTNWNVDYNGAARMFEDSSISGCTSGSDCFAQYWTIYDSYSFADRVAFDFVGGPTACTQGESRFRIFGGAINGEHIGDSIGLFAGKCVDTIDYDIAQNTEAIHAIIENGHANKIQAEFENSSSSPSPIFTCNGGTGLQSCTKGNAINCETAGECHDNVFLGGYVYTVGTAFEFNNDTVISGDQIQGVRVRSNSHNYIWNSGATCNTQLSTTVLQPDCVAFQATMSVSGTVVTVP
jgi:hypothetical protein